MRTFKGGGGSAPAPQDQKMITTDLPEYAEPYFRRLMQRGEAESLQGYTPYGGQRLAYFSPDELTSQAMARGFGRAGTPQEFTDASARYGAQGPIGGQFTQGPVSSGYVPGAPPPGYTAGQVGPGYQGATIGSGYRAGDFDPGYQAGDISQDYQAGERESGYTGEPRFGIQQFGPGFSPGTVADPQTLERYMSPYQQNVTDIQKREARRQSEISSKGIQDAAAVSGGLGGYREAIMQSERERNLGQQLGDIQQRGTQAAFENAQQAFEADRAARLQAGQLGLQTGQAREQALQAGERFGQQQFMTNEQLRQQQQQAELGAYQAGEQARQQAGAMGLSAQQQEDAARQAQERFGQQQFATNEQLRQQQQQADLSVYQAGEAARQQAGAMGMTAQEIEDRGRQAENQARMSAQQFNVEQQRAAAELGLRGLGFDQATRDQQLRAAQQLGGLGSQEQQMAYERLKSMQAAGEMQRQLQQQGLSMQYQDFLRQQAFPREQLGMFNQMLRGLPITPGSTQATYGGPSSMERLLGSGIAGVGLYRGLR
jgi:hypothetical protein